MTPCLHKSKDYSRCHDRHLYCRTTALISTCCLHPPSTLQFTWYPRSYQRAHESDDPRWLSKACLSIKQDHPTEARLSDERPTPDCLIPRLQERAQKTQSGAARPGLPSSDRRTRPTGQHCAALTRFRRRVCPTDEARRGISSFPHLASSDVLLQHYMRPL